MSQVKSIFNGYNGSDGKIARIKQLRELVPGLGLAEAKRIMDDEWKRQNPKPVGESFKVVTTDHGNVALIISVESFRNYDTRKAAINTVYNHIERNEAELRIYEDGDVEEQSLQCDASIVG